MIPCLPCKASALFTKRLTPHASFNKTGKLFVPSLRYPPFFSPPPMCQRGFFFFLLNTKISTRRLQKAFFSSFLPLKSYFTMKNVSNFRDAEGKTFYTEVSYNNKLFQYINIIFKTFLRIACKTADLRPYCIITC